MRKMKRRFTVLRKCAFGFAFLFLTVYLLDYVPGIMDVNGKMFGLFSMTTFVDIGHLGLGVLALISAFVGQKAARVYFWFLGFFYAADVITYAIRHLHLISPVTNLLVNLPDCDQRRQDPSECCHQECVSGCSAYCEPAAFSPCYFWWRLWCSHCVRGP
jgi:hypothetical protein